MDMKKLNFQTRLEQLQFSLSKSNNEKPSSQADAYRDMYIHLSDGRGRNQSPEYLAYLTEADRSKEMYANIVDNMDDSGLNNYAAGALSLCHYHKNESSKWQTSLTPDSVLSLPCFQDMSKEIKTNQMTRSNITIPVKRKRVIDSSSGMGKSSLIHSPSTTIVSNNTYIGTKEANPGTSVRPPPQQFINNSRSTVPQNSSLYSSNVKENKTCWKKQPEAACSDLRKRATSSVGIPRNSDETYKSVGKPEHRESINISTAKVGGPYANFGQKPKKGQHKWDNRKEARRADEEESDRQTPFRTAREQFLINQQKKNGNSNDRHQVTGSNYGAMKKCLGTRRGPANKFVPPVLGQDSDESEDPGTRSANKKIQNSSKSNNDIEEPVDERLKGIDPNMIELIKNDIMDQGSPITWTDIAGLEFAKKTIQEIVVWPMLRPDIFTGLRGPPKGLLLFGPPGTGKTLIGKCIASQSKSTFFCISASSLTSKWVGEGEKMVRALFAVARCSQPAVVFIDEVDSLLSQRSDSEHESSRRIKTEFLVQLDGASTASDERLLVIGATNRPQEIDEAARRRFVKRLLIPLPEKVAREQIIVNLVSQQNCELSQSDLSYICDKTDGYSGADMSNLCREAALGPIRSIPFDQMETITSDQVRPMLLDDFEQALLQVRASVSPKDLELYKDWNKTYGSFGQ